MKTSFTMHNQKSSSHKIDVRTHGIPILRNLILYYMSQMSHEMAHLLHNHDRLA
jgi:hypothetical protein